MRSGDEQLIGKFQSRIAHILDVRAEGDHDRIISVLFATEQPVARWYGIEQLQVDESSMQLDRILSGGAPFLLNHDPSAQVGVLLPQTLKVEGGEARIDVKISRNEDELWQDLQDGIKKNISVGYYALETEIVQQKQGVDTYDSYKVTKWEPVEVSLVAIPADIMCGVGRSKESLLVTDSIEKLNMEKSKMPEVEVRDKSDEAYLLQLGRDLNDLDMARHFLAQGKTPAEFKAAWLEKQRASQDKATSMVLQSSAELGLSPRELKEYSILRMANAVLEGGWEKAGFEFECHKAVEARLGRRPHHAGAFFIPYDIKTRHLHVSADQYSRVAHALQRRDQTVGTPSAGGYLVGNDYLGGSFIDQLYEEVVAIKLGARFIPGLVGDVTIPKQLSGGTAYWVSEGVDITESGLSFGQLSMSPKTLGAVTEWTRKLMLQSSPAIEQLVIEDMGTVMALEVDRTVINGAGTATEPRGILNTSGVSVVDGTSFTFDDAVQAETALATNLVRGAQRHWLMHPTNEGTLKTRLKVASSTFPIYLIENGVMNGYPVRSTTQQPSTDLLFGVFSEVLIGEWGAMEMLLNPYAKSRSGNIEVTMFESIDIQVRYPQAFVRVNPFS